MFMKNFQIILVFLMAVLLPTRSSAQVNSQLENNMDKKQKLAVLWTSGDREVALKMVFMYTYNAAKNEWWDEIDFIIWGPSSKLLSEDTELQEYLSIMKKAGIHLFACKACADEYGVSSKLEELEIEVKYMGKPLTDYLQMNYKVISF